MWSIQMVILVIYNLYSGLYKWLSWLYIIIIHMVILVYTVVKWLSWLYINYTLVYTGGYLGYIEIILWSIQVVILVIYYYTLVYTSGYLGYI